MAATVIPTSESKPVNRMLGQGVAISLSGAGGMPASAQASKAETVTDAQADAVETTSAPVPTTRPADVDAAEVRPAEDSAAEAEPETAESRPAEMAAAAEPLETANVVEQETTTLVPEAPESVTLSASAVAIPPRPQEKPVPRPANAVAPAPVAKAAMPQTPAARQARVAEQVMTAPAEAEQPGEDAVQALAALSPAAGDSQGSGPGTSAAAGAEGGNPGERADFFAAVQAWLEQHKRYPRRARMRNETGTVLVRFVLLRDGRVREFEVLESSGYAMLDAAAGKMIERAQPMPKIPEPLGQAQLELVVPIAFELR